MTDKFKVEDLVIYIPTSGEIIKSHIGKILKIKDGYIFIKFRELVHKILPTSIHHYPLQIKNKNDIKFEIEI
jgi:hypothetical protein